MPKLYYQGHGSFRITSNNNIVIYVDPYAGIGYDLPADIILVTHQHSDHNQINLCNKKPNCVIITNYEALKNGQHNTFNINGIIIQSVEAENKNHSIKECVGYIINVDNIKIYALGDTSKTNQMSSLSKENIDYALLPLDGIYNMSLESGSEVANIINAKYNIPIHLKPGELFSLTRAENFKANNKIIIKPNEEIELINSNAK